MEQKDPQEIIAALRQENQNLHTMVSLLEGQIRELEKMLSKDPDKTSPPDSGNPANPAPDNGPRMRQAPTRVYQKANPEAGKSGLAMGKDVF